MDQSSSGHPSRAVASVIPAHARASPANTLNCSPRRSAWLWCGSRCAGAIGVFNGSPVAGVGRRCGGAAGDLTVRWWAERPAGVAPASPRRRRGVLQDTLAKHIGNSAHHQRRDAVADPGLDLMISAVTPGELVRKRLKPRHLVKPDEAILVRVQVLRSWVSDDRP